MEGEIKTKEEKVFVKGRRKKNKEIIKNKWASINNGRKAKNTKKLMKRLITVENNVKFRFSEKIWSIKQFFMVLQLKMVENVKKK